MQFKRLPSVYVLTTSYIRTCIHTHTHAPPDWHCLNLISFRWHCYCLQLPSHVSVLQCCYIIHIFCCTCCCCSFCHFAYVFFYCFLLGVCYCCTVVTLYWLLVCVCICACVCVCMDFASPLPLPGFCVHYPSALFTWFAAAQLLGHTRFLAFFPLLLQTKLTYGCMHFACCC